MRQATMALGLFVLLGGLPVHAQEAGQPAPLVTPPVESAPAEDPEPASPSPPAAAGEVAEVVPWQTVWGAVGLAAMPVGLRVAPNGIEYHPNFSLDLDFNFWIWRNQGLYLFMDGRVLGEKSEHGVTNGRDGWVGTSKREFDLSGGAAWNYLGKWEARAFGYTYNNLNRGFNLVNPDGFADGFGVENRYYLSPEYARLGQTGFDVARATFLSIGYYASKNLVGNQGDTFQPGLFLRAYLTYDVWDSACYAYGDIQYIGERSFRPKLLRFDVGLAVRPFRACRQCEFRLGTENTADLEVHNDFSIGYLSVRYIF
jgi:hypothetical protein